MSTLQTDSKPQNGSQVGVQPAYKDCLPCRLVGTATLGGVGIYALYQSRAQAPGSAVGKRVMAGLGVCMSCSSITVALVLLMAALPSRAIGFLVAGVLRWTK